MPTDPSGPPPGGFGASAAGPASGPASRPMPGWYEAADGRVRWWDGTSWGVAAPSPPPPAALPVAAGPRPGVSPGAGPRTDNALPMFAHLSVLLGGVIVAAILYVVADKNDPWQRWHVTEALNFQLSVTIASVVLVFGGMIVAVATFGLGMLLVFPLAMVVSIGALVYGIMAAVQTSKGVWYRYPISFRFFR